MLKQKVEHYIHAHIPISKAIGIRIDHISTQKAIVSAPFANNVNHTKTVFGGSLAAVATLACWSLLHGYFQNESEPVQVVVKHSEIDYLHPVTTDFKAQCLLPEAEQWQRFLNMLATKKRARIDLSSTILQTAKIAVNYRGTFAVIKL